MELKEPLKNLVKFSESENPNYKKIAHAIMERVSTSDEDKDEVSVVIGLGEVMHAICNKEQYIKEINKYMERYHVTNVRCDLTDRKRLLLDMERDGYRPSNVIEWEITNETNK